MQETLYLGCNMSIKGLNHKLFTEIPVRNQRGVHVIVDYLLQNQAARHALGGFWFKVVWEAVDQICLPFSG